jgi:hypothetical protein
MATIASRKEYLQKVLVDGVLQYDLGSFDADGYDFGKENFLVVRDNEACRPDLISMRAYGTMNYWWFIMWYNGITDIWNDLRRDSDDPLILKYPDIDVVRDFLISVKKNDENIKEQNED